MQTTRPKQTTQPDSTKSVDEYHRSDLPAGYSSERPLRHASVLIPVLNHDGNWKVLYIRRSQSKHDRHSGQVAFPGGAREQDDTDAIATALRETHEEIGISSDNIRVIHTLPEYETVSYFRVTPVVGILNWPTTMKLQSSEVARAFTIPLEWLLDESNYSFRDRPESKSTKTPPGKRPQIVYFKEYDGEILWGASARITLNFLLALRTGSLLIPGFSPTNPYNN